jgi:hypothetical protein
MSRAGPGVRVCAIRSKLPMERRRMHAAARLKVIRNLREEEL